MKRKPLLRIWRNISEWKVQETERPTKKGRPNLPIRSFPVAVRLDARLKTGSNESIPASRLVWLSPIEEGHRAKALETTLLFN